MRYKVETPCCISAVHLYSPSTNSWVKMSSGDLPLPRSYAAATQLQKGEVIFVGGLEGIRKPTVTDMRQVRGTETGIKCNEPTRHVISHQMSHSHSLHYKHYQKLGGQPTVCNRLWCLGQTWVSLRTAKPHLKEKLRKVLWREKLSVVVNIIEKRAPELKNDTCSPFQKVHSNLAQNHSEQTS